MPSANDNDQRDNKSTSSSSSPPHERVFAAMATYATRCASTWEKLPELQRTLLSIHYGWSHETITRFCIGFDDGYIGQQLVAAGYTLDELVATGIFFRVSDLAVSRFANRIVFPYLNKETNPVYFAARATEMTEAWADPVNGDKTPPKYVKTKRHAEGEDDGISTAVENVVWSTHETGKQPFGIIAEGMPDAISAAQAGYPVRSAITTMFKRSDAPQLDEQTRNWGAVVLVPDQEANGEGMRGAREVAMELLRAGRDVRLVVLPHEDIKNAAAERVKQLREAKLAEGTVPTEEEIKKAGNWKTDLNDFLAGDAKAIFSRVSTKCDVLTADAGPGDGRLVVQAKEVAKETIRSEVLRMRAERQGQLRSQVENSPHAVVAMIGTLPADPTPTDWSTSISAVTEIIAKVRDAATREACIIKLKDRVGGNVKTLRDMVSDGMSDEEATEAENPLVGIVKGLKFFRILTDRVFTVIDGEAVAVDGKRFAEWASHECLRKCGHVVANEMISNTVRAVIGPVNKLPRGVAAIRYGYDPGGDGSIWIDLADAGGHYVHVTAKEIEVTTSSPVTFYRPSGTMPMAMPDIPERIEECQQSFRDYWDHVQIEGDTCVQLYAVLMSAMRPMENPKTGALTRYTVGVFNAGHGRAKTSRQASARRLADPREPISTEMPSKSDDLTIHSENTACISLENISGFTARESDHLCRIATGDGKTKRSLYTNRDEEVFRGSRPVLMNGIGDIVVRDDLLDRSLTMMLTKPKKRKGDKVVEAEFIELWPRVFGAFLYCMKEALGNAGTTTVDEGIRMIEAAQWAAAAEVAADFEMGTVSRVYLAAKDRAAALARDEGVVQALLDMTSVVWVKETEWSGQAKDLYASLTEHVENHDEKGKATKKRPEDWPKTPRGLRAVLDRKLDSLAELGILVRYCPGERTKTSSKAPTITLTWKPAAAAPTASWAGALTPPGAEPTTTVEPVPRTVNGVSAGTLVAPELSLDDV